MAIVAIFLAMPVLQAAAQAPATRPGASMPIERHIAEWQGDCRGAGGRPSLRPGFRTDVDLNGDGALDAILDITALSCAGMETFFCGSGGCPMAVLIAGAGGYRSVFQQHQRGWRLDRTATPPVLLLDLHGSECGRVGSERCRKRYAWNGQAIAELSARAPRPTPPAPATRTAPAVIDVWRFGNLPNGVPLATAQGPGMVEGFSLACANGAPFAIVLLRSGAPPGPATMAFLARGERVEASLINRNQPLSNGRPVWFADLRGSRLPGLLVRGGEARVFFNGAPDGALGLSGAPGPVRAALSGCYRFE